MEVDMTKQVRSVIISTWSVCFT